MFYDYTCTALFVSGSTFVYYNYADYAQSSFTTCTCTKTNFQAQLGLSDSHVLQALPYALFVYYSCFSVESVRAKSFQVLDVTYSAVWEDPSVDSTYFSISANGDVTLLRAVTYITDKQQFRATVTATEAISNLASTEEVQYILLSRNVFCLSFEIGSE